MGAVHRRPCHYPLLNPDAMVALAGSKALVVVDEERLLKRKVVVYDEWCAARGLA